MGDRREPVSGWQSPDEPRFRTVRAPDTYPKLTDGPVLWAPVSKSGHLIGYVWAAETGDAADFFLRPGHPMHEPWLNTRVTWVDRLRQARAQGLTAVEALEQWGRHPEEATGELGARQRAESLHALRALAERRREE
jgi:hypothetical protein